MKYSVNLTRRGKNPHDNILKLVGLSCKYLTLKLVDNRDINGYVKVVYTMGWIILMK